MEFKYFILLSVILIIPAIAIAADPANEMKIEVRNTTDDIVHTDSFDCTDVGGDCSGTCPGNFNCDTTFYECDEYGWYELNATSLRNGVFWSSSGWVNAWLCCDMDADGYDATAADSGGVCSGDDCDDTNPAVNPGVPENCGNTIDDDCNGFADSDDCSCLPACGAGNDCTEITCNATYKMVCRVDDATQTWEWINRSLIVPETNCSDGYDNDCNGGFADCNDHINCDGVTGPNNNYCCDPADPGAQIINDCQYNQSLPSDNSECVIETCAGATNQCVYTDRPACNTTECAADEYCNQSGGFCMTPDLNNYVCEHCFNYTLTDYGHWDNVSTGACCEYPIGGPFTDWCTNFDTFNGLGTYPLDPPGDSCVGGVWYDSHCADSVNNCDEDPAEIDCGFGAGPPSYTSCGPCCDTCACIDIVTSSNYITTKTLVEQKILLYFTNSDPTTNYPIELYIPDPYLNNLRTCYGKLCGPWNFYFTNSTGDFAPNITIDVPAGAAGANIANFTFLASGPTPIGKYEIEIGLRNPGTASC